MKQTYADVSANDLWGLWVRSAALLSAKMKGSDLRKTHAKHCPDEPGLMKIDTQADDSLRFSPIQAKSPRSDFFEIGTLYASLTSLRSYSLLLVSSLIAFQASNDTYLKDDDFILACRILVFESPFLVCSQSQAEHRLHFWQQLLLNIHEPFCNNTLSTLDDANTCFLMYGQYLAVLFVQDVNAKG